MELPMGAKHTLTYLKMQAKSYTAHAGMYNLCTFMTVISRIFFTCAFLHECGGKVMEDSAWAG